MSMSLNDALREFEAVEANLVKLEILCDIMQELLPDINDFSHDYENEDAYEDKVRAFKAIHEKLPAIDGYKMPIELDSYENVFNCLKDIMIVGDDIMRIEEMNRPFEQKTYIKEYRFKFDSKRRQLVRSRVKELFDQVEAFLIDVQNEISDLQKNAYIKSEKWDQVKQCFQQIDALLGSSVKRPPRWEYLIRHLGFGMKQDFYDIINHDLPAVKSTIEKELYSNYDPFLVSVSDLSEIVSQDLSGPVITKLNWNNLSPDDFELLIYNLLSESSPKYENVERPMKTNAPDSGRDISAYRVIRDPLSGTIRQRLIIQCKNQPNDSVNIDEISKLCSQMNLWEPPRVDVLVIATSGHFTKDAVLWIEKHNQEDKALRIEMWPETHLESLLVKHPALIAEFKLR